MTKQSWKNFSKTLTEVFKAQELTEEQSENILKALENKQTSIAKAFRPRAPKDPNHPKKPLTSYLRWAGEVRASITEELKKKNPKQEGKDRNQAVMTELAKRWEALSAEKKAKYEKAYKKDKEAYDAAMENYTPPATTSEDAPARKSRKGQNTGKLNKYTLFCKEMRPSVLADNPNIENKEVMTELANRWKEVSEEERAEYAERAKTETASGPSTKTTKTAAKGKSAKASKPATTEEKKTATKPAAKGKAAKASKPAAEEKKTSTKGARTPKFNETAGYKKFCEDERAQDESNVPAAELQKRWLSKTDSIREQYEEDAREAQEAELEDEDN